MRWNICSCLLVFVLGCKVTAAIKHEVVEEKQSVSLPCPHSVEGEVTWSRETNGHRVDILTADGDADKKHISDPGRRYSSLADKSLYIRRVNISDSGTYLCNNKAAVELTVIPSETTRLVAPKSTTVTLNCPLDVGGSHVPTWRQDRREVQQDEYVYVSPVNKTLTIRYVQPDDSGLYYCDGKPAAYLTVMEAETSDRGTTRYKATEKTSITLNCPRDVGGSHVPTWSKDGSEVQEDRWVYVSPVNKTLTLTYVQPRDSGLYYCDGKPAVYLTVMEAETSDRGKKKTTPPPTTKPTTRPTPTTKPTTKPTTTTKLMPTTKPTTTKKRTTTMKPTTTTKPTTTKKRTTTMKPTPTTKPTTTTKPTQKRTTTMKPTTTKLTSTTSPSSSTVAPPEQKPPLPLVIGIVVPLLLIILLLIFYLIHRRSFKRRGTEERCHVYDEIQGGAEFQLTNGVERVPVPTDAYCMVECPGGSNPNDATYYTIPDLQPMKKATETSGPDESLYSEICETFISGNNNEGSSQPTDNTYCLLQNPKTSGKHPK